MSHRTFGLSPLLRVLAAGALAVLSGGAAARQAVTPGLQGQYWGPGTGIPAAAGVPGGAAAVTRVDLTVDFANATFVPPYANADNFVIRWTGFVRGPVTGTVTFFTNTDDGVELAVNTQLVINDWQDQAPVDNQGTFNMIQDVWYPIRLTFYERGGGAECHLSWSYPNQARIIIPSTSLSATPPPPPPGPALTISTPQNYSPVIDLGWTSVTNASSYDVLRGSQSGTASPYATVPAPATTYRDTEVGFFNSYFYVVQASVGPQTSAGSNEVSGQPQPLPPRTQKVGNERDQCGCGAVRPPSTATFALIVAAGLLLLARRRGG